MSILLIFLATLAEVVLIVLVLIFFLRLKKSEATIARLQENQEHLLERVYRNASLEQELVATFSQRQEQLSNLVNRMEERILTMKKLLAQAEEISRSPHFLREVILNSRRKGLSIDQISLNTGLARDEVELILAQEI